MNRVVTEGIIETTNVVSQLACGRLCNDKPGCVGFNTGPSGDQFQCDLSAFAASDSAQSVMPNFEFYEREMAYIYSHLPTAFLTSGTDLEGKQEWVWQATGEAVGAYTPLTWNPSEPDKRSGENYLFVITSTTYADHFINSNLPFACEKPAQI